MGESFMKRPSRLDLLYYAAEGVQLRIGTGCWHGNDATDDDMEELSQLEDDRDWIDKEIKRVTAP